ncbi:PHA/PHB synthase family protein [Streptomyces chrestomyceticus]|uniref:PHA/PHB synthase family protein n=1 Tax=Streptomyces chrestomyceticus TaxID=68185 RepID=UPI00369C4ECD
MTSRPARFTAPARHLSTALGELLAQAGLSLPRPVHPEPDDRRHTSPAWNSNRYHRAVLHVYLSWRRAMLQAAAAPAVPPIWRRPAEFLAQSVTDALSPGNFLLTNPAALHAALTSRGASLARGAANLLDDLAHNRAHPAKMPPDAFVLGQDLAASPGRVVYRNHLMELLQYEPQTREVHEVPLLLLPAFVNKYYIYDLAPGRSLVEWAVRQGFTVFTVSLRDPGPCLADAGLEDYFLNVPLRALEVVESICATDRTHLVGLCAGGIFAGALAAWLAAGHEDRAATLTLLMAGLDYADPVTGRPVGATQLLLMSRWLMGRAPLIPSHRISDFFDLLRAGDTLWEPLARGWLQGKRPEPFDIVAWSQDGIAVPRPLFDDSMRLMGDNLLAHGRLRLAGRQLHLPAITADVFAVASLRDHIVPWQTVYQGAHALGGTAAFHLVPSGHVGSVINPPRPTAGYWAGGPSLPPDPARWLAGATLRTESWWMEWTRWLAARSGTHVPGRPYGNNHYPAGSPAPGQYARGTEAPHPGPGNQYCNGTEC